MLQISYPGAVKCLDGVQQTSAESWKDPVALDVGAFCSRTLPSFVLEWGYIDPGKPGTQPWDPFALRTLAQRPSGAHGFAQLPIVCQLQLFLDQGTLLNFTHALVNFCLHFCNVLYVGTPRKLLQKCSGAGIYLCP